MTYTLTHNPEFNSIEIFFDGKPAAEVREALKGLKFRWHNVKKCWYGRAEEAAVIAALNSEPAERGTVQNSARTAPAKAEKVNKFGVKVGDLFYMSWGWEQTNIDMFQVVELVGAASVRVRQVMPQVNEERGISDMSRDISFKLPTDGEMLPASRGIFVKDDKRGDLHRLIDNYGGDGCHIKFDNRYCAYPYGGGTLYESWYA